MTPRSFLHSDDANRQWVRIVMNRSTRAMIEELGPDSLSALEISGDYWQRWASFKEYTRVEYPHYDLCEKPLERRFDLVIAEQVFEHLPRPYRAARNVLAMLEPGGHFLITVPFLIKVHDGPEDCTRWTETGLKHFLAECGFPLDGIATGSWGNRAAVKSNLKRWTAFRPWLHSLRNEPGFPVSVWALARK